MKWLSKFLILFNIGGIAYYGIEFLWKNFVSHGLCHWSMYLLGGLCFVLIGEINNLLSWDMSLLLQGVIGTGIITGLEGLFGWILNIRLGLGIWDYSNVPLNIKGQVCLPFCIAWFFLSLVAIFLDDFLRWKLFKEEKPHYCL